MEKIEGRKGPSNGTFCKINGQNTSKEAFFVLINEIFSSLYIIYKNDSGYPIPKRYSVS